MGVLEDVLKKYLALSAMTPCWYFARQSQMLVGVFIFHYTLLSSHTY